ncbi:predicted protein [Brucella pinnipedialis M163/99/10]|nr:predicted protein [Brucella pinnipedialis M163/99/10]
MIGEGGIGAFGADFQDTGRFDGIEIFTRHCAGEKNCLNDACGCENLSEFHFGIRDLVAAYLLIAEN